MSSDSENEGYAFPNGFSDSDSDSDTSDRPLMVRKRRANQPIELSDSENDQHETKRQRYRSDFSKDKDDHLPRRRQERQANVGGEGNYGSTNSNDRVEAPSRSTSHPLTQDTVFKQEAEDSQQIPSGNTETCDGVLVEALPEWVAGAVYDGEAFMEEGRLEQVTYATQIEQVAPNGERHREIHEHGERCVVHDEAEEVKETIEVDIDQIGRVPESDHDDRGSRDDSDEE